MSPGRTHAPRGFTLIELLVVVLIIGILAAIALPRFLGQRTRAKNAAAQAAVRHALVAARSYYTQNSESYVGLGPTQLRGYESSLSGTEAADSQQPGASGANPQDIWIGNGLGSTNPDLVANGDPNGGSTVVLCSVSRGDAVYCVKDVSGVTSYLQASGCGVSSCTGGSWNSGGWSGSPAPVSVCDGGSQTATTQCTYSSAGSFSWIAPSGVSSVAVQAWGGGGGGSNHQSGRAGGGGAYAGGSVAVSAGTTYTVTVGAAGTRASSSTWPGEGGGNGGASSFSASILAAGGAGGTTSIAQALGGQSSACTGTTKVSGGNGGRNYYFSGSMVTGGGGGGSAGSTAIGNNGTDASDYSNAPAGGSGGSGGGAAGGAGGVLGAGSPGVAPGGGGGSGGSFYNPAYAGAGAAGRVILTW